MSEISVLNQQKKPTPMTNTKPIASFDNKNRDMYLCCKSGHLFPCQMAAKRIRKCLLETNHVMSVMVFSYKH